MILRHHLLKIVYSKPPEHFLFAKHPQTKSPHPSQPITDSPPAGISGPINNSSLLWSLQGNTWRGSCAVTPSCRCQSSVRSPAPRTAPSAPGRPGPSAHTPARARAPRASRRELAPSSPTTQEKVGAPPPRDANCFRLISPVCNIWLD